MIQIYGRKKCKETKKAQRFFSERSVPVQLIDLDVKPPAPRELEVFARAIGPDDLIDPTSKAFRDRGMEYLAYDPIEEISDHPELLRTPIVREGHRAAAGADEAFWKSLVSGQKP